MSWSRPKRKVPTPETIGPHRSANPLFPQPTPPDPKFRQRVWLATSIVLIGLGLSLVVIGPWWQIETVTVAGVRQIDPASVRAVIDDYLTQRRFGLIPNRNLLLLSQTATARYLQTQIEARLSVEKVTITKLYPHGLHVVVTERTPVAIVREPERLVSIDRTGTIIEVSQFIDPQLPVIDEPIRQTLGQAIFSASVMHSIQTLHGLLSRAQIETQSWTLPIVKCPAIPETLEVPTTPEPVNQNSNTNDDQNTNTATGDTHSSNTNRRTRTLHQACDDQALAQTRPEIHVQMKDGPKLLFDRFQPLDSAVQSVRRILAEPEPPTSYIDVRFGNRVFVQ